MFKSYKLIILKVRYVLYWIMLYIRIFIILDVLRKRVHVRLRDIVFLRSVSTFRPTLKRNFFKYFCFCVSCPWMTNESWKIKLDRYCLKFISIKVANSAVTELFSGVVLRLSNMSSQWVSFRSVRLEKYLHWVLCIKSKLA